MILLKPSTMGPARMPLHCAVDRLILAIGTPRLAPMLFDLMRTEFAVEHAVIIQKRSNEPVEFLFARNARQSSLTRELCARYANYHVRDPVLTALGPARERELVVCSVAVPDISDAAYRSRFFLEPNFAGKISIIARRPNHLLYLNFYRSSEDGPFNEQDLQKLNACSRLIAAIAERHFSLAVPARYSVEELVEMLKGAQAMAALSPRELETCARIAMGFTIERIAQDMSVSENSAVTFRRRAFAKLGIATHKDLYLLLLCMQPRFPGCADVLQ